MSEETLQPRPAAISVVVHLHDPGFLADEEISRLSTAPLETLAGIIQRHLDFRFALYLPGRILESAARTSPRILDVLRQAGATGRLEWLGGGFHDPLFAQIPDTSRKSQIQMLGAALRQHAGAEPHGLWLPGFVWDPSLVSSALQSGFMYTVLKDHQIPSAAESSRMGWFLTEELGVPFRLLPSNEAMGALFRAGAVEEMLQLVSGEPGQESPGGVLDIPLLASSREGFEPIHLERLNALAELCAREPEKWELVLPGEAARRGEPLGTVYPPPSASKAYCSPGAGGGVRDLLRRERWANLCHKRMLHLLSRTDQVPGPRVRAQVAEPLLQAQNASFFRDADEAGGIRFLRDRVRLGSLVLEAESALDQTLPDDSVQVDVLDLLCEGAQQVLVRNSRISMLLEPRHGGRIAALDHKPRKHPWGCPTSPLPVLSERFLASIDTPDANGESVSDFDDRKFEVQYKRTGQDLQVMLSSLGNLKLAGVSHPLLFEKTLTLRSGKSHVAVTYKLTNPGAHLLLFGLQGTLSISPSDGDAEHQRHKLEPGQWVDLRQTISGDQVKGWEVVDKNVGATLEWDLAKPTFLEALPLFVRRPGESEGGRLDGLQAKARWEIRLAPGESWSLISRIELGTTRVSS
ncbi:MAG: alpha-amylase/4-alpha-glucanotransferase domain-containing protein [Fibrobacterota bacterium]